MINLVIHRGTQEIGGSCVEIWTENTRIVLDIGMPLVESAGIEFDFQKYKTSSIELLITNKILPDIPGLYSENKPKIDALFISHAHKDHYGLMLYIHKYVPVYLGKATQRLIELTSLFSPTFVQLYNTKHLQNEKPVKIRDIEITPYLLDHSAFDAYGFLIRAGDRSIFYSGDFRGHGRKAKLLMQFMSHPPSGIKYLLLEGTTIGQKQKEFLSEKDIEDKLYEIFTRSGKINLVYTSGQNIDRLVSIYKACLRTGKIMVIDVYIAIILSELARFACLPYPSEKYKNLKVWFSHYLCKKLKEKGLEDMFYQFKNYKITKGEININLDKIVLMVRPSLFIDLKKINIDNGNMIYSMWKGYIEKPETKTFLNSMKKHKLKFYSVHTSGHAYLATLQKFVEAIQPEYIIPIHTFNSKIYKSVYKVPVKELKDREVLTF